VNIIFYIFIIYNGEYTFIENWWWEKEQSQEKIVARKVAQEKNVARQIPEKNVAEQKSGRSCG
jgi:hypothetical protein